MSQFECNIIMAIQHITDATFVCKIQGYILEDDSQPKEVMITLQFEYTIIMPMQYATN